MQASCTTYAAYYGLLKNVEDGPRLPRKKAARSLAKFASLRPNDVEQNVRGDRRAFQAATTTSTEIGGGVEARDPGQAFEAARAALPALLRSLPLAANGSTDVRPLVAF